MENLETTIKRLKGPQDAQKAYCCMTEVPTPWPQALCMCRDWVTANLGQFVEGYHMQLADGKVVGHLYFAPSERALFPFELESEVTVLYCDWVQRRYQGMGMGKRLFAAFLEDMRQEGCKGVVVEATDSETQMHYRHYLKRGFEILYEKGNRKVLYLPLAQPDIEIRPLATRIKPDAKTPVEILILNGYLCPYEASTMVLIRDISREFGEQVALKEVWLTPETLREYGQAKGVFINGQLSLTGAETEASIRQAIQEAI
jgi:GNAT superfamily N-acetyltransferase